MWDWLTGLPWKNIATAVAAVTGTGASTTSLIERRARIKDQSRRFYLRPIAYTDDAGDGAPAKVYEFAMTARCQRRC